MRPVYPVTNSGHTSLINPGMLPPALGADELLSSLGEPFAKVPQRAEYLELLEQPVGMEVVQLAKTH